MRIGQPNMNISKLFSQGTVFSPKTSPRNYSGINTIDDLRSGHFKNSYGVEGMGITGKNDWRRVINVSDEMKNHVLENVKKSFYKYGGMSGSNVAEHDAYYDKIHSYVKTLNASDRRSAPWTLSQLHLELAGRVTQAVKVKDSSWTAGKPISHEILDEIFSDDTLLQDCVNAISGNQRLDTKI